MRGPLDGGGGLDTMTGNGGADVFEFTRPLNAANLATITDFAHGEDLIALDNQYFRNIGDVGAPVAAFFTDASPTTTSQRLFYEGVTGMLFYDRDGAGTKYAGVAFAQVTPGTTLDAGDFQVV